MEGLHDGELLDLYARQRSEDAFRELVKRHIDFVYSAAMRQLSNHHLAEEATQATFVALAGKAGQLRSNTILAGWLYRAVHFAALNLRRTENRREFWENKAATVTNSNPSEDVLPEDALPHVDGVLASLSDTDRDALVLRFLQQKTFQEVAAALGTSEDAAKKRVTRALEKLRGKLARQGFAVSVLALSAALMKLPAIAAPSQLATSIAAGAISNSSAIATQVSTASRLRWVSVGGAATLCTVTFLWWATRIGNTVKESTMRISLTSVMVDDQEKALGFYSGVLGFVKKQDIPMGGARWLTVVSPLDPNGTELLLEPMGFPPAKRFQSALREQGIPLTAFHTANLAGEYQLLTNKGVTFTKKPERMGPTFAAILDDTCGNLIQLVQSDGTADTSAPSGLRIKVTSVLAADQAKALTFYTDVLGFEKKTDVPAGEYRWLTVVSPGARNGTELLLEPMGFEAARVWQSELRGAGIPLTSFGVRDVKSEHDRLAKLGVTFTRPPMNDGFMTVAIFDDTCGNLIQMHQE